jgi:mRNA-degrading endonuclease RelE of RelBE toxin-antitoxin system
VKLAGQNDYRIRVGDYRIVYAIDDGARMVLVARIAPPRRVPALTVDRRPSS